MVKSYNTLIMCFQCHFWQPCMIQLQIKGVVSRLFAPTCTQKTRQTSKHKNLFQIKKGRRNGVMGRRPTVPHSRIKKVYIGRRTSPYDTIPKHVHGQSIYEAACSGQLNNHNKSCAREVKYNHVICK